MRKIGNYPDQQIHVLVDYLIAEGIASKAVSNKDGEFELWVIDEDHLDRAKQTFLEFKTNPGDSKYGAAAKKAKQIRKETLEKKQRVAKNVRVGKQSFVRRAPVIFAIAGFCVFAAIMSEYTLDFSKPIVQWLSFNFTPIVTAEQVAEVKSFQDNPNTWSSLSVLGASLERGELWRMFTPALLHASIAHLIFNLLVFVPYGRRIESNEGRWFTISLILASAAIPNLIQGLMPEALSGTGAFVLPLETGLNLCSPFCGISGVCFAFMTFIWLRGQEGFVIEYRLPNSTMAFLVILIVVGFTGLDEKLLQMRLANWAHAGGAIVGLVAAYLPLGRTAKR